MDKALINGSADPVSGEHMPAGYRELARDGLIYELPGIDHYPQMEAPNAVTRYYLEFLGPLTRRC
jgi:hypothetical protein